MLDNRIDAHLGKRLRRRRRILGLTQQQLAGACGVRFQQIQKYECAANRMSAARLWQLAEILEVPVSFFYEGLGEERKEFDDEADEIAVLYIDLSPDQRQLVRMKMDEFRQRDAA